MAEERSVNMDYNDYRQMSDEQISYARCEVKRYFRGKYPGKKINITQDEEEDLKHATDFLVKIQGIKRVRRVLVRTRGYGYFLNSNYKEQVTLRCRTQSGFKTEYQKILDGWGDYLFYAFKNKDGKGFVQYDIVSLNSVRKLDELDGMIFNNKDKSKGIAFWKSDLKVVKHYEQ